MSIYQLKERFQGLLRPSVNFLYQKGVTANQVTLFAIFLSVIWGGFIVYYSKHNWPFYLLPLLFLVRMALNAMDGMLAKEHNQKSPLGAVLNELGDVISDTSLYLPFVFVLPLQAPLIILIVIFSVISEMAGVIGIQIGSSRRYEGPMGKSDRAFVFGLIGLLLGFHSFIENLVAADSLYLFIEGLLYVVMFLLVVTIWNRSAKAIQEVHNDK